MAVYNHFPKTNVIIGEWLEFDLKFDGYSSSEYALSYFFVGVGKNYEVVCTANEDGSFHFAAEVEGDPDEWKYQGVLTNAQSRKFYVDTGRVVSEPNFATLPNGQDNRSHVKRTLDALEAMIEGKANSDQIYYMIEGRALSRIPPQDLMLWYEKYKAMYADELRRERQKHGKVSGKIYVGFR